MHRFLGWLIALGLILACEPASAQVKVGVIVPDQLMTAFTEPFRRGVGSTNQQVDIETRAGTAPDLIMTQIRRFIDADKRDLLVVAGPTAMVLNVARQFTSVGFVHLGSATDTEAKAIAAQTGNVVTFGPLPQEQRKFLATSLSFPANATLIGSPSLSAGFQELETEISSLNPSSTMRRRTFPPPALDEVANILRQEKPAAVGGFLGESDADALARRLADGDFRPPLVIFSPPPAQTRGYLAGRFIGVAIREGAKTGPEVVASIKKLPRFRSDVASIGLPWSIRFQNLSPESMQRSGPPTFYYKPNQTATDNTEECSCKNKDNKPVSCKQCEPGKCKTKDEGTDYCSTECSTS